MGPLAGTEGAQQGRNRRCVVKIVGERRVKRNCDHEAGSQHASLYSLNARANGTKHTICFSNASRFTAGYGTDHEETLDAARRARADREEEEMSRRSRTRTRIPTIEAIRVMSCLHEGIQVMSRSIFADSISYLR